MELSPALKRSLVAEDCPFGEALGGDKLFLGTQRHICCLFLPQGWLLVPRYAPEGVGQEAPGAVFPADGIPSVLWEQLSALSKAALGGWGRALPEDQEWTYH